MALIRQAGAIIVNADRPDPQVLLVTSRRRPDQWIFPKGHVEQRESLEEAALREAEEEAGVTGRILGPAGRLSFTLGSDTYEVHYFVMVTRDPGEEREGRRLAWCSFDEASARLPFEDSRRLLAAARPLIAAADAGAPRRGAGNGT